MQVDREVILAAHYVELAVHVVVVHAQRQARLRVGEHQVSFQHERVIADIGIRVQRELTGDASKAHAVFVIVHFFQTDIQIAARGGIDFQREFLLAVRQLAFQQRRFLRGRARFRHAELDVQAVLVRGGGQREALAVHVHAHAGDQLLAVKHHFHVDFRGARVDLQVEIQGHRALRQNRHLQGAGNAGQRVRLQLLCRGGHLRKQRLRARRRVGSHVIPHFQLRKRRRQLRVRRRAGQVFREQRNHVLHRGVDLKAALLRHAEKPALHHKAQQAVHFRVQDGLPHQLVLLRVAAVHICIQLLRGLRVQPVGHEGIHAQRLVQHVVGKLDRFPAVANHDRALAELHKQRVLQIRCVDRDLPAAVLVRSQLHGRVQNRSQVLRRRRDGGHGDRLFCRSDRRRLRRGRRLRHRHAAEGHDESQKPCQHTN